MKPWRATIRGGKQDFVCVIFKDSRFLVCSRNTQHVPLNNIGQWPIRLHFLFQSSRQILKSSSRSLIWSIKCWLVYFGARFKLNNMIEKPNEGSDSADRW